MSSSFGASSPNNQSVFLPQELQVSSKPEEMNDIIAKRERLTANCLNLREIAQYQTVEGRTGQSWFSTTPVNQTLQPRSGYRLTFDLVAMNAGVSIPVGATTFTLTATTVPRNITIATGITPTDGYGACTNSTTFYFINDPLVFVRTNIWTNASQTITITNNTGSALTQAYWVFEYIKR